MSKDANAFWQFAGNWGWESFLPDAQSLLEVAFQNGREAVEIPHVWYAKKRTGGVGTKRKDCYKVDLGALTSTAMQGRYTVRRIRRVQMLTGEDSGFREPDPGAEADAGACLAADTVPPAVRRDNEAAEDNERESAPASQPAGQRSDDNGSQPDRQRPECRRSEWKKIFERFQ